MSYTEIYGITKNNAHLIGVAKNSWRGAMAIWGIIEKKYLPSIPKPDWEMIINKEREYWSRTCIPHYDQKEPHPMQPIWSLVKEERVSKRDKIVLSSTFDNVLVKVEDIEKILSAFREFDGETNLKEQADIIENAIKNDSEIIAIGWNQTSVCSGMWCSDNYDEDKEEYVGYNIETGDRHWFLFDDK